MEKITYLQFINELNCGKIKFMTFAVKDYAHYNFCKIERKIEFLNMQMSIMDT